MREVFLYNSLSQQNEKLTPLQPGKVSMYVCGPTVYGDVHIGNMRPVVVFDVLRRFLIHLGYDVHYVSNYTDIDDKIIMKAKELQTTEHELAARYIAAYEVNVNAVGSLIPQQTPKVTEHMDSIVTFIQSLLEKGFAYEVQGDVYFRVGKIESYGELSHMDREQLLAGARVEGSEGKESPFDFALWKKTTMGIRFPSTFGEGRPGWHTECVVMIHDTFAQHRVDIHGGGFDLKFPHHENELAQHHAFHPHGLASIWMHNGFINLNDEKMSKSTGTLVLAKDFIASYGGPLLRYVLLATHYRIPVNFNDDVLVNAKNDLEKIRLAYVTSAIRLQRLEFSLKGEGEVEAFLQALADDLNTANALTEVHAVVKQLNKRLRQNPIDTNALLNEFFTIRTMLSILGLDLHYPTLTPDDRTLFADYEAAKARQDYASSDALRQRLMDRGLFV